MYLAGILGLCALLYVSPAGAVGSGSSFLAPQEPQPAQSQPSPAGQAAPQPEPPQKESAPEGSKSDSKSQGQPTAEKKPAATKHRTAKKKNKPAPGDPKKTVVKHGSTAEPTTQLSPGITEEQAARQRETTHELLSSTDAALEKLDVQQLSGEQKDTVGQIRKFMQQAKAAEAEGDPQRSYKLALKAHLLTDALGKP